MKPKLIGLAGFAGSGKSTVAEYLDWKHSYVRYAFATKIKAMLGLGLGLTLEEMYGEKKNIPCDRLGGKTPRHAMQTLGTEWGRNLIYPDLWCDLLMDQISREGQSAVVIEDVRFQNEVSAILKRGGIVWEIVRNPSTDTHPSEQHLHNTLPIFNNSDIRTLHQSVTRLVESY
jgi:hypothetical protein